MTFVSEMDRRVNVDMNLVKRIINDWDPIDLFPGAPDDEYWTEIDEIEHIFRIIDDPIKLAERIYAVFIRAFGDVFKKSKSECEQIAQMIIKRIKEDTK